MISLDVTAFPQGHRERPHLADQSLSHQAQYSFTGFSSAALRFISRDRRPKNPPWPMPSRRTSHSPRSRSTLFGVRASSMSGPELRSGYRDSPLPLSHPALRSASSAAARSFARSGSIASSVSRNLEAAQADVTRVRFALEGSRSFGLGGGAVLTPSLELTVRHDGGDAETGTGVEAGAGIHYSAGAFSIEGRVHTLIAHEDSGYEDWGASGALRVNPSPSGRDLSLTGFHGRQRCRPLREAFGRVRRARTLRNDELNHRAYA